jgi:Flp pilus assembly pilin Flp
MQARPVTSGVLTVARIYHFFPFGKYDYLRASNFKNTSAQHKGDAVRPRSLLLSDTGKGQFGGSMELVRKLWREDSGQDIAEYAVMLAVILVIVVGTIRLIGSNSSNVFSQVASSIQ